MSVLDGVPGQDRAMRFLRTALARPHHAYVFAGPEGSGKSLGARAFVAALLCADGGCGRCRDCRLALSDRHPNEFVVEPEGRDIHVETIRQEVWRPASRTPPEPGRKVFVVREADRLSPAAADTLLKVLEEPPADTVFLLLSARANELPDTIVSRSHVVTFAALPEAFVVDELIASGVDPARARLAARLSGGNLGRARRMASGTDGLAFREAAERALELASTGPAGALEAADVVMAAAGEYRDALDEELAAELEPFRDELGQTGDAYRGAVTRIEARFKRRKRRAERDHVDRVLMAVSALLRDRVVGALGGPEELLLDPDMGRGSEPSLEDSAGAMASIGAARADLAEDLNLNTRLVLERAFLAVSQRSVSRSA